MPVDADLAMAIDALQRRRIAENTPAFRSNPLNPLDSADRAIRQGLGSLGSGIARQFRLIPGYQGLLPPETPELPPGPIAPGVESGGSSTAPAPVPSEPSGVKNAMPQEESGSYLRYRDDRRSLAGPPQTVPGLRMNREIGPGSAGEWREFKGGTGGGAVSMMTAPENAERVTYASRMEDLDRQMREQYARKTLEDPLWQERAKQQAKTMAEVEAGRAVRGDYSSEKAFLQQKAAEAMAGTASLPPDQKAARVAEITAKLQQLESDLDKAFGFSQRTGGAGVFGSGQGFPVP